MKRPNAAKTSDPSQTARAGDHPQGRRHRRLAADQPDDVDREHRETAEHHRGEHLDRDVASGDSGVSRSCRLQPSARSMETMAPPLVVASIAPYSAMLIMMNADTLPWPAFSVGVLRR